MYRMYGISGAMAEICSRQFLSTYLPVSNGKERYVRDVRSAYSSRQKLSTYLPLSK